MGSVEVGRVVFCSFRWVRLGWVEYEKVLYFLMITQHTIEGPVQVKLNTREYEEWAFFDQYLGLVRKRYKIRP